MSRQQQVTHLVQNDAFSTWHELSENMNDIERLLAKNMRACEQPQEHARIIPFVGIDPIGSAMGTIIGNTFYNTIVGIVSH